MKTRKLLSLAGGFALLLLVQACGPTLHSGIHGELSSEPASTSLSVPSTASLAIAGGTVTLAGGTASVVFTAPSGRVVNTWGFEHSGSGGNESFEVGPYSITAEAGEYVLEVSGDKGSYDVSIEAR